MCNCENRQKANPYLTHYDIIIMFLITTPTALKTQNYYFKVKPHSFVTFR